MTKAEEVNGLENEISSLTHSLEGANRRMKKVLMDKISKLKDKIEVIIEETTKEETFFDKFEEDGPTDKT